MLKAPIHLHVPRNTLQGDSVHDFARDQSEADPLVVPQIVPLAFFKMIVCNNLFQIMLHTSSHLHTQHNLCTVLSLALWSSS